jgi:hypothetical protein
MEPRGEEELFQPGSVFFCADYGFQVPRMNRVT